MNLRFRLVALVRASQHLYKANQARQKCEQLRISFPNAQAAQEAQVRLDSFQAEYNESIKDSEKEFRIAESEFAARKFRFPDKIATLTTNAFVALSAFAQAVNDGHFSGAELEFETFKDRFKSISTVARGWRLADPFEGIRQRFRKPEPATPPSPYALSDEEMQTVLKLVNKRAMGQAQNSFAVHPPRKLIDNPELANSEQVIKELEDSSFVVVFQDGTTQLLSLVELMAFTHQLMMIKLSAFNIHEMLRGSQFGQGDTRDTRVEVKYDMAIDDIMRPATVKHLLNMIDFSTVASDDLKSDDDFSPDAN